MIRAAALSYAIIFALLIGLICSGILLITGTQKKIEIIQTNKEHVLLDSYAAIQYGKTKLTGNDSAQLIHSSGDTSLIYRKPWGGLTILCARTKKGNIVKQRAAILGVQFSKKLPCLLIPGNIGSVHVAGNTRLEGDVCIPNKQIEQANFNGYNYKGNQLVYGRVLEPENNMPQLLEAFSNSTLVDIVNGIAAQRFIEKDSSYSFHRNSTYFQQIEALSIFNSIYGNVVIQSFDSIFVRATARLENVILVAPKIRFEKGFVGTVQVLASEQITVEEGVKLNYPSYLVLNEQKNKDSEKSRVIHLEKEATVLGGILMTTQDYAYQNIPKLYVDEAATVAGLVYCVGSAEVRGAVIGHLYSSRLDLHFGGSEYKNYLLDATISSEKLPTTFCLPLWFKDMEVKETKVIAWL